MSAPVQMFSNIDKSFLRFYTKVKGDSSLESLQAAYFRSSATVALVNEQSFMSFAQFHELDVPWGICRNVPDKSVLFLNQKDPRNPDGNVWMEISG